MTPKNPIIRDLNHRLPILKKIGCKRDLLFGSYAWGDEHTDSDIDILVEFNSGKGTFDNFILFFPKSGIVDFIIPSLFQSLA
ncbi:hypothetical protein DLD82_16090 [Methanospirillum stamsii]|uniref:Polymerase nucleotidyl transferase domain-containing protein n=1 Tax=Methanospirillum stamsii TaxID=1277351 RepID=A0A2V2MSG4_9EURY|nr:hypothetical protein DLD82_16090 [Methanospirillum stamsii]